VTLSLLRYLLTQPEVRGVDLDAPGTVDLHRSLARGKPFLRSIYNEWYTWLAAALPEGEGRVLELGSGGGFLRDLLAETIASDVVPSAHVDVTLDGQALPFGEDALRGIAMTNVLHHLPDVRLFLEEAGRCVRPGGVVAMIEPWYTPWARLVYGRLHHEELKPDAMDWAFESTGPLSSANIALPWIIFERDRSRFEAEFPQWRIELVEPFMPLRYLLSGGVSVRSVVPVWSFGVWKYVEESAARWNRLTAMFAKIVLTRTGGAADAAH
jgi:SAM-dependent methyltransferase